MLITIPNQSIQDLHEQIPTTRLVFIDPKVENYPSLAAGVLPNTSVVILDADQDGIEQISQVLATHQEINSLHIVSHGKSGAIQLGNGWLTRSQLQNYVSQLESWKSRLTVDADILLYGCDVAKGEEGIAFVEQLSQLTGANVAASNNLTGSIEAGGDWNLEVTTGLIKSPLAFSKAVLDGYTRVLAEYKVTNTQDDNSNESLRKAIEQANATLEADTIVFDGSLFNTLQTIKLQSELLISGDITITGTGKTNLIISGDANNNGNNDSGDTRVFFVSQGNVKLENLTVSGGYAQGGNGGDGISGGGGAAGLGGGLLINDGSVTLKNVTFDGNQAIGGIGGIGGKGGGYGAGGGGIGKNGGDSDGNGGNGGNGGNFGGEGGFGINNGNDDNGGNGGGGGGGVYGGNGGIGGGGGGGSVYGGNGGIGGGGGGGHVGVGGNGGSGGNFGGNGGNGSSNFDNNGGDGGGGAGLGGAVFIRTGSLTLDNATFSKNTAQSGTGANPGQGKGGAIFILNQLTNSNGNDQGMPASLPKVISLTATFSNNNDALDAIDNNGTSTNGFGKNQDNNDVFGTISLNTAPSLTGNATLTEIAEDTVNPNGSTITNLFNGKFSDPDTDSSLSGIAIVGNTADANAQGRWQYSIDGDNWNDIGTVADDTALVLSANTKLRFLPVANYNGTPDSLSVRALDNTYSGFTEENNPVIIDTTENGNSTSISANTATISTSISAVNDEIPNRLTNPNDDVFNITGQNDKATLEVKLTGHNSPLVNELGLFTVDDPQGTINGIAPGAEGYAQAAILRSQVILSAIANTPNGFDTNNLSTLLQLNSGQNFRFLLVQDGTLDSVRNDPNSIGKLLFSNVSTQKITDLGDNSFSLGWKDASGKSSTDFNDLVVKINQTDQALPLGTNLQGEFQGELIDLRDVQQSVEAEFNVYREASYNNYVGFYQVTDENGGIDTNGDGIADVLTGQAGYTQAAVRGKIAGIDLSVSNQGSATYNGVFQPGAIFAPFIIVNATPDTLLDDNSSNDPAVYFPFLGANSDHTDHISLLASNTFGFEDLANGGDKDFNDLIIKVNLTTAMAGIA
ncbi:DUF4347 domain-containing protein [Nostoc sp.]|uniref:DUF4347 domain-containing protein n=1 Tax=Nostoc sp. TaxID=1180 RepID=UPI002FF16DED